MREQLKEYEWMLDLNVGDKVVLQGRDDMLIEGVTHVTPTQVHVKHWHFRKADGRELATSVWYRKTIHQATPELVEQIRRDHRRQRNIARLNNMTFADISDEKIERILSILDESA